MLTHADFDHPITQFIVCMQLSVEIALIFVLHKAVTVVNLCLWGSSPDAEIFYHDGYSRRELSQSSESTTVVFTCPLKLLDSWVTAEPSDLLSYSHHHSPLSSVCLCTSILNRQLINLSGSTHICRHTQMFGMHICTHTNNRVTYITAGDLYDSIHYSYKNRHIHRQNARTLC